MPNSLTVIRHAERPSETLPGGAAYQPILGDDTCDGVPIRTGIQTSHPGYATPLHSHPYAEVLTVIERRGEAWLDGEEGTVAPEPGIAIVVPQTVSAPSESSAINRSSHFGIHTFGKRIVNYVPPLGHTLKP